MEIAIALIVSALAGFMVHWVVSGQAELFFLKFLRNGKLILFVSEGGTCRDPMATAITKEILKEKLPESKNIKVMGAGIGPARAKAPSFAARHVIHEIYGKDLLKGYRPNVVTQRLVKAADLILVMDHGQLSNKAFPFPPDKTYLLKDWFELEGEVRDPHPDGRDEKTISRYRECAEELKTIIEDRFLGLEEFIDPSRRRAGK